ncbi:MAG TPA: HEAT repeat domain-containing protein [Candidatus Eisenbacteria bacterium]
MPDLLGESPLLAMFLASALATLGMAVAVLRWHDVVRRRDQRAQREGDALAIEFARFISGRSDAATVRDRAAATRPDVLWTAIESFAEGIEGEEWRRLTRELRELREIAGARARVRVGTRWVRALAARRLGLLEDADLERTLVQAMVAGPPPVTLAAGLGLARLRDHRALDWLIQHPESLAGLSRHQLVALIKRFGPDAVEPLRRAAALEPTDAPVRVAAIDVLGLWRDEAARPRIEWLLANAGLESRIAAARALGAMASPASLPALVAGLRDLAWQVRAQAARALGSIGPQGSAAVPALVQRTRDLSWWVRRNATYALGRMGPAGRQALEEVAERDPDRYARDAAAEVLQMIDWEGESPGGQARVE